MVLLGCDFVSLDSYRTGLRGFFFPFSSGISCPGVLSGLCTEAIGLDLRRILFSFLFGQKSRPNRALCSATPTGWPNRVGGRYAHKSREWNEIIFQGYLQTAAKKYFFWSIPFAIIRILLSRSNTNGNLMESFLYQFLCIYLSLSGCLLFHFTKSQQEQRAFYSLINSIPIRSLFTKSQPQNVSSCCMKPMHNDLVKKMKNF